jgi:mannose-6-phosphate isomerase
VKSGDYIFVPLGSKHRIKNESDVDNLVFVEVQTGTYFGEDDIVRLSDDFGR